MRLVELLASSSRRDKGRIAKLMPNEDFSWGFRNFFLSGYMTHEASVSASAYLEVMDSGEKDGHEIDQEIKLGKLSEFSAFYLYINETYKERAEKYEIGGPRRTSLARGLTFEASNLSIWEFTRNGMEKIYSSGVLLKFDFGFGLIV
jgi:hypothetical protein